MAFVSSFAVMLMLLKLALSIRNERLEAIKAAIDNGAGAGKIYFYTAPVPTPTGADVDTQLVVAVCDLQKPCGIVANGELVFSGIAEDLAADNTGTIGFGRIVDFGGAFVADGDAGLANSSAMFRFNKVDVIQGGKVRLLSIKITEGNA
jgi:hypothetical protein